MLSFFRSREDDEAEIALAQRVEPPFFNASPESPTTNLANPDGWLIDALGGTASDAGVRVNEESALRSTTVFRCVSLITGLLASLPLKVYETLWDGSRKHRSDLPIDYALHDEPNEDMGSFTWRQLMGVNLLCGGNSYDLIETNNAGEQVGFFPIPRNLVTPFRDKRRGNAKRYRVEFPEGPEQFDQDDILHIPGLGFDGMTGLSPIGYVGKNSIGLDLAMMQGTSAMHANGVRMSGMIEVPPRISKANFRRLQNQVEQKHTGTAQWGKIIWADIGSKFHPMQISPEDAQTLESRRFSVTDICRIFGVPPHLAMETDASTSWGTGIEQQTLTFLRFSLEPWLKAIEDELKRKLFSRTKLYAEFDRDALLAMDAKTQAEIWGSGVQNGVFKPAEIRRKKNLEVKPGDGSDELYGNSTLMPLRLLGQKPAAAPPKEGAA